MKRFLVTIEETEIEDPIKFFKVSEECDHESVTYSEKTIAFFFIHTMESKEEIKSVFQKVRFLNEMEIIEFGLKSDKKRIIDDDITVYFIGKPYKLGEINGCMTKYGFIPFNESMIKDGIKIQIVD